MKRLLITIFLITCCSLVSLLYGTNLRDYQVVEIYLCDDGIMSAEMKAMASVSRQDLYSVSYCTCFGMDKEFKTEVRGSCDGQKTNVYSCTCIGRSKY